MWYEEGNTRGGCKATWKSPASPDIRFERDTWEKYIVQLRESGNNALVIDVGEALLYKSHPEISCRGAWTHDEMKAELDRLNAMGFEVIPKLNFSTTHDTWMGKYAQMVSTPEYYAVCRDLIDEVCELFEPRFFHLGMDEEVYENQRLYNYVVIRQNELWWHDLYYLIDCVEKHGARAMMWSDYARHNAEEFIEKCPKSVVQCVWYYFDKFDLGNMEDKYECRVRPFKQLADAGFDQIPSGSVVYFDNNLQLLTEFCMKTIPKEHLLGFMQTTWEAVESRWQTLLDKGCESVRESRAIYEKL